MAVPPRSLPAFGGTPSERATTARALAFLFAAGATLVAITVLLPHGEDASDVALLVAAGLAYVTAAALAWKAPRVRTWLLQALLAFGTLLVSVCVVGGGDSASAYPLMYVWVALYAGYVFRPLVAVAETAWAAVACGVAFVIESSTPAPSAHWLMGAGTIVVAGLFTGHLTSRVRGQHADLVTVAEMAYSRADITEVGQTTCTSLRSSARADAVALLEPARDGVALELTAQAGSRESALLLEREEVLRGIQVAYCFGRAQMLIDSARGGRLRGSVVGHAQPIVCEGVTVGVLALAYDRPRHAVPARAVTAALLFAGEASVAMERAQRLARDSERRALDINDSIVQGLTVAKYAISQGHTSEGMRAIDDTLRRARELITSQLSEATAGQGGPRPGDLVRETPVEEHGAGDGAPPAPVS